MLKKSEDAIPYVEKQFQDYLPGNSIDCVIFGYKNQALHMLLLQWKLVNVWALPGGFIRTDEDLDKAAQRILLDRTSLDAICLKQFHTFGNKKRTKTENKDQPKNEERLIKKLYGENEFITNWFAQRFISTSYFALVNIEKTNPRPDMLSEKCEWKSLKEIPALIFDHNEIVQKALEQLRIQLNYLPVGMSLLPDKFTMQDLQKLYEAILQKPLERSNFQRKILKLDFLNRHEKQMSGGAHKAPYLYSFDELNYNDLIKHGIGFF
jgi:8-oxo-dGTP diphosphatase